MAKTFDFIINIMLVLSLIVTAYILYAIVGIPPINIVEILGSVVVGLIIYMLMFRRLTGKKHKFVEKYDQTIH